MKKVILILSLLFPILLTAEETTCDYSKQVALQSLAVHVNYSYEYSESAKTFSIIFNNVVDDILLIATNADVKYNENKQVIVQNLSSGTTFTASIVGSNKSGCNGVSLRTIRINIPYVNSYYNTSYCNGYEELSVCKSRFLDYDMTSTIFNRSIQNYNIEKKKRESQEVEEKSIFDNAITFLKTYYIEIGLVLLGTVPTIIIGNAKLRKIKHGF